MAEEEEEKELTSFTIPVVAVSAGRASLTLVSHLSKRQAAPSCEQEYLG